MLKSNISLGLRRAILHLLKFFLVLLVFLLEFLAKPEHPDKCHDKADYEESCADLDQDGCYIVQGRHGVVSLVFCKHICDF